MIAPAFNGAAERQRDEWRRAAFAAHQTAMLGRADPKKAPSLSRFMGQFDAPRGADEVAAHMRRVLEALTNGR